MPPLLLQQLTAVLMRFVFLTPLWIDCVPVQLLTQCVKFTLHFPPLDFTHDAASGAQKIFFFPQKVFLLIMRPQECFLFNLLSVDHFQPAHDRLMLLVTVPTCANVAFCFSSANRLLVMSQRDPICTLKPLCPPSLPPFQTCGRSDIKAVLCFVTLCIILKKKLPQGNGSQRGALKKAQHWICIKAKPTETAGSD